MAKPAKTDTKKASENIEATLFATADKLRGAMDASEYKHIVLGLIFLKFVSDAFEGHHARLAADPQSDAEDPEEYLAENVFWVPRQARWPVIQAAAKTDAIGKTIDAAMAAVEASNDSLKGVLAKDYGRPSLNKTMLGQLIDLVASIQTNGDTGTKDLLGRVYEYFLGGFAGAEGKRGGEFYTPPSIVGLLVEMLEPYKGRVYDPCCGSGGMFVQSEKFVAAHGGKLVDVAIYGQEMNNTTWKLAKMNMAIRGIEADIRWNNEGSFHRDEHKDLKADFILANPPFNISDWGGDRLREDKRWIFGAPPVGNANFGWLSQIYSHLAPRGTAGVVLANGSMSSQQSGEGEIRRKMIEMDAIDCMVSLPGQLFYGTQIPACLWFLARSKTANGHRDRTGELLFIDARKLGHMIDRTRKDFSPEDIALISDTYHRWRAKGAMNGLYEDVPGFCRSASLDEIKSQGCVLTPGRYVGAVDVEDDGILFNDRFDVLRAKLLGQFKRGRELETSIERSLAGLACDE